MVVLGSVCRGTPVIASKIGSHAEVVDDGFTGIPVERCDGTAVARRSDGRSTIQRETVSTGANARHYEE